MPRHCSLLTAKYIMLCRMYSLAVQEVFNGRYQIGKETGRKQRLRGGFSRNSICVLWFWNNIFISQLKKYITSAMAFFFSCYSYNQFQQSLNWITNLSKECILFPLNAVQIPTLCTHKVHGYITKDKHKWIRSPVLSVLGAITQCS